MSLPLPPGPLSALAIGGYFELEMPLPRHGIHAGARRYQSARAALAALLQAGRPGRIWMPNYVCDAVPAAARGAGIDCVFYSLDDRWMPDAATSPTSGDWLLYVNYFGILDAKVDGVISRFGAERVIIDNSQALFSRPRECLASVYSPRKFVGIPDGGLLLTALDVPPPGLEDSASPARCTHLLKRLCGEPENGYADFKAAEATLEDTEPRRMSRLTERMLEAIDFEQVRVRRNANFHVLHELLGKSNRLDFDPAPVDGPLCYPLLPARPHPDMRAELYGRRILVATYWPEALGRVAASSLEAALTRNCLPLPCDQRYSEADMRKIAAAVQDWV